MIAAALSGQLPTRPWVVNPVFLASTLHGCGTKGDSVVVGEQHVLPTRARQDAVGSAALTLDRPADTKQSGACLELVDGFFRRK